VSECACCSCARQMRSTHPGSRSSLMTLLVTQSHLCVQGGTPQCPAPLRALPQRDQSIGSSNLAVTQQERKSNGHFSLSAPTTYLTSPHLPEVGQCSNRRCNRCGRLLCARRERVTEGALSRASHSALSHHSLSTGHQLSFNQYSCICTALFPRTVQKGGLMIILSAFVRVDVTLDLPFASI
jgi:hypothetical protein